MRHADEGIRSYEMPTRPGCTEYTDDADEAIAAWKDNSRIIKDEFLSVVTAMCEDRATLEESERKLRAAWEDKSRAVKEAAKVGYIQGHDDTVKRQCGDPDDRAADIVAALSAKG